MCWYIHDVIAWIVTSVYLYIPNYQAIVRAEVLHTVLHCKNLQFLRHTVRQSSWS